MQLFDFIIWNADPEIVEIGFLQLRWYGLLFAMGFIISQQILYYMHKVEGKPVEDVDTLTVYMVVATIIGARLGHVFFYEPAKYLADPIQILMIHKGGLASHGAAVAILIAIWIYANYSIRFKGLKPTSTKVKRPNQSYLQVLDRLVILVAMTAVLIRLGNFVNSEIEGKPSGSNMGVFFARNVNDVLLASNGIDEVRFDASDHEASGEGYGPVKIYLTFRKGYEETEVRPYLETTIKQALVNDRYVKRHIHEPADTPLNYELIDNQGAWYAVIKTEAIIRYPTQLIESSGYLLVFIFLYLIWRIRKGETPEGQIFGWFMVTLWSFRFVFEFFKANQVEFEEGLPLNMGQMLSIPLILVGIIILIRSYRLKAENSD